jgi:hypothetical protein
MWQGAAQALKDAELIAFIGYSFPPSDTEMKYFLAGALAENAKLRKIMISDLYADSIVERLKQPMSGLDLISKISLSPLMVVGKTF